MQSCGSGEYGDAGALVRNFSLDKINKNVLSALRKHGVTDDEIKRLLELNTISADGIYSDANLKFARNIVEKCFPIPGKGVKMRKILPLEIVEKYHLSSTANVAGSPKTVGGFVAQADHCEVESAGQIFNDFRLDYPDTQFSKNKSFAVIEYENVGNPIRPYNSPDIDGFGLPNTKTGMLGSDEKIIPEFYLGSNPADFPVLREGAILKIYNKDGKVLEQYQLQKNTTWKIY